MTRLLRFTLACATACTGALTFVVQAFAQAPEPLALVQTIPLPQVRGRIDHLDIDVDGERLFIAALGNDSVEVIDLRAGRRSMRLEPLQEPQGVAWLAESKTLLVASGRSGRVDFFAGPALVRGAHIDGLEDADNVRYVSATRHVYVGYGSALAVIDPAAKKVTSSIKLSAHPESFQIDATDSHMFVNVPNAAQVAVVDRQRGSVVATWNLGEMRANFPMALDEAAHRLFVATRRPAALLVYDTETGRRVTTLLIDGDADDLFFDAEYRRIYAICGNGAVDVIRQQDADHYASIARVTTAAGARTGLFSAVRKTLYVALPARGGSSAEVRVYSIR
jgi:DNA-binding beta-propeller fold protein YncE